MDPNKEQILSESHAAEAQNAEVVAMQAKEKASRSQMKEVFAEVVQDMFDANPTRYIDVSRVPLICQAIVGLSKSMETLQENLDKKYVTKEEFSPVKMLVYGAVSLMCSSVLLALIYLVVHTGLDKQITLTP